MKEEFSQRSNDSILESSSISPKLNNPSRQNNFEDIDRLLKVAEESKKQKILEETVDLLREIGSLLMRENWKKLQEIEFKTRLSRFNIGKYQLPRSILRRIFSVNFQTK